MSCRLVRWPKKFKTESGGYQYGVSTAEGHNQSTFKWYQIWGDLKCEDYLKLKADPIFEDKLKFKDDFKYETELRYETDFKYKNDLK